MNSPKDIMILKMPVLGLKIIARLIINPATPYFFAVEKVCLEQLEKNPDDRYVKWFLSNHYVNHGKLNEAQILLASMLAQGLADRKVMLLLSRTYFKMHRYNKVIEILNNNVELRASDVHNFYLGCSFIEIEKYGKAIEYLEKYVEYYPKDFVGFVKLGYAFYKEKLYELSLDAYKKAEELNPVEVEIKKSIKLCSDMLNMRRNRTPQ